MGSTRDDAEAGRPFSLDELQGGSTADDMLRERWQIQPTSGGYQFLRPPPPPGVGGRRKHWTLANEPQFFGELDRAAHNAVRAGEDLSASSLARYGIGDRRTISAALALYGYDLDKIQAEAIRCTQGGASFCTFRVQRAAEFKKNRV